MLVSLSLLLLFGLCGLVIYYVLKTNPPAGPRRS